MITGNNTNSIDYKSIDDPAMMEQELINLIIELDAGEYDDFDEWEAMFEERQPQLEAAAKRAAELNIKQGLHLYGDMLLQLANVNTDKKEEILAEARICFEKAASLGCWGAMSDLARDKTDELELGPVDIVVYNMLDEDNANPDRNYWNGYLELNLSEAQFNEAMEKYHATVVSMEKNSITKQSCNCLV